MKLIPKNWVEFQHYKDRAPPWIKLHKALLDDYDFQRLPVASRALAPMLWLLASEVLTGEFDGSATRVAFRLRMTESEYLLALRPLLDAGFFKSSDDASALLAACKLDAMPEERRDRGETEAEIEPTALVGTKAPTPIRPDCPYAKIADCWNRTCQTLPKVKGVEEWADSRRRAVRSRWSDKLKLGKYADEQSGVEYWRRLFEYVEESDFLRGKDGGWRADFDWVMNVTNLSKVIEGKYENKATKGLVQ